jgi:hypothetical protein
MKNSGIVRNKTVDISFLQCPQSLAVVSKSHRASGRDKFTDRLEGYRTADVTYRSRGKILNFSKNCPPRAKRGVRLPPRKDERTRHLQRAPLQG